MLPGSEGMRARISIKNHCVFFICWLLFLRWWRFFFICVASLHSFWSVLVVLLPTDWQTGLLLFLPGLWFRLSVLTWHVDMFFLCVCVCVCARKREGEIFLFERGCDIWLKEKAQKGFFCWFGWFGFVGSSLMLSSSSLSFFGFYMNVCANKMTVVSFFFWLAIIGFG